MGGAEGVHAAGHSARAHHALSLMYCTGQPSPSPPVFATRPSTTMGGLWLAPSIGDGTPASYRTPISIFGSVRATAAGP